MDELGASSPFATINESGGIDYAAMNKGITPIFFTEPVPDEKATEEAGAVRMFELEMVRIQVAGDMLNVATAPVDAAVKERFAVQYEAWKTRKQARHIEGTPLKDWPLITALRIAEFEAVGIFSVENLSSVSDTNVTKLADGRVWREKATAWLKSSKDNGAAAKYAAENERLRSDMDAMRKSMQEQIDALSAQSGGGKTSRKDAA